MVQHEATQELAKSLQDGDAITVTAKPTTKTHEGITFVEVETTEGVRSSSGKQIVGFLMSPKVQKTIESYVPKGGLDMFVKTVKAEGSGRDMLSISYFE